MAFPASIANDFLVFDGGMDVTLTQVRGGQTQDVAIRNATNAPLTNQQIQALSGVSLTGKERSWSLNASDVGSNGVVPGDRLNDGTNDWQILTTIQKTLGNRWSCVGRMIDPSN